MTRKRGSGKAPVIILQNSPFGSSTDSGSFTEDFWIDQEKLLQKTLCTETRNKIKSCLREYSLNQLRNTAAYQIRNDKLFNEFWKHLEGASKTYMKIQNAKAEIADDLLYGLYATMPKNIDFYETMSNVLSVYYSGRAYAAEIKKDERELDDPFIAFFQDVKESLTTIGVDFPKTNTNKYAMSIPVSHDFFLNLVKILEPTITLAALQARIARI